MRLFSTLRHRLALAAALTTGLWVVALAVIVNAVVAHNLDNNADADLRTRAAAAAAALSIDATGTIHEIEAAGSRALDENTWTYNFGRAIDRAKAPDFLQKAADQLAASAEKFVPLKHEGEYRLYALPIVNDGIQVGTVVTVSNLDPLRHLQHITEIALVVLAGLLLLGVYAVTLLVVRRTLDPVGEMAQQATRWSETDIQHRFGARGGPAELEELAASLDGLLERVAAVVRHEQQLSAELSHELRTPLARIAGEVELLSARSRTAAERKLALERITESAATMSTTLETLLDVARANVTTAPGRCDVAEALATFAGEGVVVTVPEGLHSGVDLAMLQRMLQPLVDNARRYAASQVGIEAHIATGAVVVTVQDDGPGVDRQLQESIFEPGVTSSDHDGAGLGLALARRLARATGGDIVLASANPAVFALSVPAA